MKQSAGTAADTSEPSPSSKRQKTETSSDDELRRFYRSWAWKREHRPDKDRFHRPYKHTLTLPAVNTPNQPSNSSQTLNPATAATPNPADTTNPKAPTTATSNPTATTSITLSIKQKKFGPEGFASTVWDSSIVMAKFMEKWQERFTGRRCLDLSAGCGLVAVVMCRLGAQVTATDLEPNLPLLRDNCTANGASDVIVCEHCWGSHLGDLQPPYDVITACDVMYITELVPDLLSSLVALTGPHSLVYIAHGRNRPAEAAFTAAAQRHFDISLVPDSELDEVYQCSDVDVLQLRPLTTAQQKQQQRQTQRQEVACQEVKEEQKQQQQ